MMAATASIFKAVAWHSAQVKPSIISCANSIVFIAPRISTFHLDKNCPCEQVQ